MLQYMAAGALALLTSGDAGCGVGCDLATCSSGLMVRVQPPPSDPYRIELILERGNRYVARCDTPGLCPPFALFENYLESRARIEVIAGTDTARQEFTALRYAKHQPNGRECDPTCHNAEVTVALGE